MQAILDRNVFFVKQHVGLFKAACNFDIQDPETGEVVLECREDGLGMVTKALRFTDFRRYTPFDLQVRTRAGEPVVHVRRGVTFFRQKVAVADGSNQPMGYFRLRALSMTTTFDLLDLKGQPLCQLKGSLMAREFRFLADGKTELGKVTKKWGGLGREMFTEADNYVIQIGEAVEPGSVLRPLILASALCIDMVLKR
jgi:uncharacterized protein YxjI